MTVLCDFAGGALRASSRDGIGTLLIGNDARRNAVTATMWRAIPQAMRWLTGDADARVVVVIGAGSTDFCAGADISEFSTVRKDAETARLYEADNSAAFNAIRICPVPTIAVIRGTCYGGGFGIAAACDLRLADETARFCIPPARLGLAYPADAVGDIVLGLGAQMAKRALFTGDVFSSDDMTTAGFLLETVAAAALEAAAYSLAATIAANAPLSVHAAKAAVRAVLENDADLSREAAVLGAATFESADYSEGRAAFAERRRPAFTGR